MRLRLRGAPEPWGSGPRSRVPRRLERPLHTAQAGPAGGMSVPGKPGEMKPAGEEERPPPAAEEEDDDELVAAAPALRPARRSASLREDADDDEEEEEMVVGGGGCKEQELTYELQQGYRILGEFLQEKHRGLTAPFLQPLGGVATREEEAAEGPRGGGRGSRALPQQPGQGMCLLKMEEKFASGQYGGITEFVADFRLMLETCYRQHGVDHWISKQGQKLEMMLEQKLALLSRWVSPVPGGTDGLTQTHPRTCPRMGWARGRGASLIGAESEPREEEQCWAGARRGVEGVGRKNPTPRRKRTRGESREPSAEEQVKFVEVKWKGARRKNYRSRERKSFSGMEDGLATFIRQFWQETFKRFWNEISLEIYVRSCKRWFQT